MKKYRLMMSFEYEIMTDDIERTLNEFEFPAFPDLAESDDYVSFIDGTNNYYEITEEAN